MLFLLCYIMFLHFVGDFVLQTHHMSVNKSKSNLVLLAHVSTLTSTLLIGLIVLGMFGNEILLEISPWTVVEYGLINGVFHFIIDWFTSRATSRLWAKKRVHDFFVVIGFDQFLHIVCYIGLAYCILFN